LAQCIQEIEDIQYLALSGINWHGFYSCRRGLGTVATDAIKDPTGAAGMLRHKTIDTTAEHYIGITKAATLRAMGEVERLYEATCNNLLQTHRMMRKWLIVQHLCSSQFVNLLKGINGGMRELVETGGLENH
jgi:hypothetical protein